MISYEEQRQQLWDAQQGQTMTVAQAQLLAGSQTPGKIAANQVLMAISSMYAAYAPKTVPCEICDNRKACGAVKVRSSDGSSAILNVCTMCREAL